MSTATRAVIRIAMWSVAAVQLAGCGSQYRVLVDAYAPRPVQAPLAVSVVAVTEANPLLGAEVQGKIQRLLAQQGYHMVAVEHALDSADLVVAAVFGIGEPTTQYTGTAVLPLGNMLWSVPQTRTSSVRWLIVAAADPDDLRAATDLSMVPWRWYATSFSEGTSSDLRLVVDYMLVPTLEQFGQNPGQRIDVSLRENDARVRALRTARTN